MVKMGLEPLENYKKLGEAKKKRFNKIMNEYIRELGENWQTRLTDDFNEIINEQVLNEEFKSEKIFVKDAIMTPELILSDQHKEWALEREAEKEKLAASLNC